VQPSLPPPAHLADAERALFQSAALSADEVYGGVLLSFVLPPPACDPQCTPAQRLRQRTLLDLLGFIGKVRSQKVVPCDVAWRPAHSQRTFGATVAAAE
jgi:hypothetical protein